MPNRRKNAKHPVIKTGLYSHLEKWDIDKRTKVYRALDEARRGLLGMFPQGPTPAICLLVDRILFKGLKLSIYERMEIKGGDTGGPGTEERYLKMSNSLREDLRLLTNLAAQQAPEREVPNLEEYLQAIRRAGKAPQVMIIKGENDD
uniref:Uncharacterized protein n=1 Tax=Desulfobacca acetoxidans TaxID=60893 RepID=A0A7C5EL30_9BACT